MPTPKKHQIILLLPILISSLALVVSAGSFLYTIRTYAVSHRPYLGVVDGPFQFVENPPRAMTWKFVVKNVGSIPAEITAQENNGSLTTQSGVHSLALLGNLGPTTSLVMPGHSVEYIGQYTEVGGPVPFAQILDGSALLDCYITVRYRTPGGLWPTKYSYSTQFRFQTVNGTPPGWAVVKAKGD